MPRIAVEMKSGIEVHYMVWEVTHGSECCHEYQCSKGNSKGFNKLNILYERMFRLLPAGGFHVFLGAGYADHLGLIQNWRQLFQTCVQGFSPLAFRSAAAAGVATVVVTARQRPAEPTHQPHCVTQVTQLRVSTTNICHRHEAKSFHCVPFLDHNYTLRINFTLHWLQLLLRNREVPGPNLDTRTRLSN